MKFSIITPVYLSEYDKDRRVPLFKKCIESVNQQDFDHNNFEHIIVNDGSTLSINIPDYPHIRVINQPNLQRLTAYNTGFKAARGEWITLLDSDDAYTPNFLSRIQQEIESSPSYKMFNCGCVFVHKDGVEVLRDPFMPKEKKVGHEIFGGGNIVNGTFVFHREIYDKLGAFPPHEVKDIDCTSINYPQYKDQEKPYVRNLQMASPYDFSAYAQIEFPEIQKFFMEKHPDHPELLVKELGNPFGNDYYLFYKYTRKYKSKPIKEYLLRVNLK